MSVTNKLEYKMRHASEATTFLSKTLPTLRLRRPETIIGLEDGGLPPRLLRSSKSRVRSACASVSLMDDDEQLGPAYIDSEADGRGWPVLRACRPQATPAT